MDVISDKKIIRKEILRLRNLLDKKQQEVASIEMTGFMLNNREYIDASSVLLFASYGSEIDTFLLITESLKLGKRVYLPRVIGDDLEFYEINSLKDLVEGYRGIKEPIENENKYIYNQAKDKALIIMPGVAFDSSNNRIGYGKGFYDRFLCDKPLLLNNSIAIGFKCQLCEHIPADEYDLKPKYVYLF